MKILNSFIFLAAVFLRFLTEELHGQVSPIFQHFGAVNPTSEGFLLSPFGTPSLTPVIGDLGLNAWSIQNSNSDVALYRRALSPQQSSAAVSAGWSMSLTLRILQPIGSADGILASFTTGSAGYSLRFGAQTNGDPIVRIASTTHYLNGAGSGYHKYELMGGVDGIASLWVDGVQLTGGLVGSASINPPQFTWGGSQQATASANAYWNEASFTIVPEPSSLALLCCAGFLLAARRCRVRPR